VGYSKILILEKGSETMALSASVKKQWIEIQKKHAVPVNAIGVKIDPKDNKTLNVWKDEGIDKFVQK
jgi:hypothetical protein